MIKLLPAANSERLSTIDVLRGLAVFGIFFVNVLYMSTTAIFFERNSIVPQGESAIDRGVRLVIEVFFTGKCYPLLAFLFGVGFCLLLNRAEQKGIRVYRFFLKRMFILFVIGAVHMLLLYGGDVLRTYALLGCLLLPFYRRRQRTVLKWAVGVLLVFLLMFSFSFIQPESVLKDDNASAYSTAEQGAAEATEAYRSGNYGEWFNFHLREDVLPALTSEQITYPSTFGLMLLGFYAGRVQLFQRIREFMPLLRKLRLWSGIVSLPVGSVLTMIRLGAIHAGAYEGIICQYLIYGFGIFLSFYYLLSMILLLQKPVAQKVLRPFQFVGRMTLTNYLLQSVISFVVFVGFGLYGKFDLLQVAGYCFAVFAVEIGLSRLWMSRFRFGPLEWVWRRLTYGTLKQPAGWSARNGSGHDHGSAS
ncbi:DUF418 domain-containing protein [Paenibacillus glycinis]|uniref:DUF418 domain-containing protein n=1 Tax=Paenibacillus glycinis TaxID=2697035 RepID=A0ABW9Y0E6_9BACL|nr:DUF418 domain-containing protein [Paenibacillus glycinis]NBD28354.1 DUF418 domain-containing protein [Paenibacillus glycinis]